MWRGGGYMHMPFFWTIVVVGLIVLIVLAVAKSVQGKEQKEEGAEKSETALDVLQKRYARGEIDDEEFEHKKQKLEE